MKVLSIIMAAFFMIPTLSFVSTAAPTETTVEVDYTITNPYDDVNWITWDQYKADLHCHTYVSDGRNDFNEMIELHYGTDFDFLAITDHGVVDRSWTDINTVPLMLLVSKFKRKDLFLKPTGLTPERYEQITTGEDRGGRGMLRIPYGSEQNPTSVNNAHVNSWFADFGNGLFGGTSDYETVIKGVHEAGGLSVINHPGEYTGAKKESDPEKAYNSDYSYKINKFTNILMKYDSCIGLDINSKKDGRTKNDRKLWDLLLQNCIPNGRNVYAIATSDAHAADVVNCGWTIHCLPEHSVDELRNSLETGTFFAASHHIKNTKELGLIGEAIGEEFDTEWEAQPGVPCPKVNTILVNNIQDRITIVASNARVIRWIADGEQIATGASIKLNDYSELIGSYVRAEIFGDGGVVYTQAFALDYEDAPAEERSFFFDFGNLIGFLRKLIFKSHF